MHIDCPHCQHGFDVIPRAPGCLDKIRKCVTCPQCGETYLWRFLPQGQKRLQQSVEAFRPEGRDPVMFEEYDCNIEDAARLGRHLNTTWQRVPDIARRPIIAHWAKSSGAPFIWLLNNRDEWGGKGWAATSPSGNALFVVDYVALAMDDKMLEALLLHEFGHFLFIAVGEQNHCVASADKDRLLRCEKLVWDVTSAWGIETTEAEKWMLQTFEDTPESLRRRDPPLSAQQTRELFEKDRETILNRVAEFAFPAEYEQFRVMA